MERARYRLVGWTRRLLALRHRGVRERGFGLPSLDAIGAVMLGAFAIAALVGSVTKATAFVVKQAQTNNVFMSQDRFERRLVDEAANPRAVTTPPIAIDGSQNCNAGRCKEIDIYTGDASGKAIFVAYLNVPTGVQRYTYTSTNGNAAPSGIQADGLPAPISMYVRDVPVTQLATDVDSSPTTKAHIAQLASMGITPQRTTYQFEHAGVTASNDVFYLHITTAASTDVVAVGVSVVPARDMLVDAGRYLPTPPPTINFPTGGSLTFFYPTAPQQTYGVHETLYHDAFTLQGGCLMAATDVADSSPGSQFPNPNPLSPPNQDSGPATFTATPRTAGLCNQIVKDSYGQTASEAIQVMGPLLVAPNVMTFASPADLPQTAQGSKTYDSLPITLNFSGCVGIAAAVQGAQSIPGAPSATPDTTGIIVSPLGQGTCDIDVTDQYVEHGTIHVVVAAPLAPTPPPATPTPPPCLLNNSTVSFTDMGPGGRSARFGPMETVSMFLPSQGYSQTVYVPQNDISNGVITGGDVYANPNGLSDMGALSGTCPLAAPPTPTPVNNSLYTCDPTLVGTSYVNSSGGITTYYLDPSCGGGPIVTPTPVAVVTTPPAGCSASNPTNPQYGAGIGGPCDDVQCTLSGSPYAPQPGWADYTQGNWWGPCGVVTTPTPFITPPPTATPCQVNCGGNPATPTPPPAQTCQQYVASAGYTLGSTGGGPADPFGWFYAPPQGTGPIALASGQGWTLWYAFTSSGFPLVNYTALACG